MKTSSLVLVLGLIGIAGHLYAMEESFEKVISNNVKIELTDGEVSITKDQFEGFKEIVPSEIKIMLEAGAPYSLHSVNEIGFDFIIKHVELIKNKDSEALKRELKELYEADDLAVFIGTLDAAAYLVIDEVLKVVSEFINENIYSLVKNYPERAFKVLEAIFDLTQKKHKQTRFFDLNNQYDDGWTVLALAVSKDHKKIIELLINAKADLDRLDIYGDTALMWAAMFGRKESVKMLIDAKVVLDIQDKLGLTALMWAAKNGRKNIVELLINAGADLNLQNDYDDDTALMMVAKAGHKEIAEIFIKAGADLHKQNRDGKTALMLAEWRYQEEIIKLFKEASKSKNE